MSVSSKSSFGQRVGSKPSLRVESKEYVAAKQYFTETKDNADDGLHASLKSKIINDQQVFKGWKKLVTDYPKSFLFVAFLVFGSIFGDPNTPDLNTTEGKKEAALITDQVKFDRCFSAWDGSNKDLVQRVKANLRDPSSFEHIETRYVKINGGLQLTMFYRAKNGFGGMNIEQAKGICSLR
jgi:hypothetical protein